MGFRWLGLELRQAASVLRTVKQAIDSVEASVRNRWEAE